MSHLGLCMLVVYVALVACIFFAHVLIYWLIKAGIEDSKKPAPLSARQRRCIVWPSCKHHSHAFCPLSMAKGLLLLNLSFLLVTGA